MKELIRDIMEEMIKLDKVSHAVKTAVYGEENKESCIFDKIGGGLHSVLYKYFDIGDHDLDSEAQFNSDLIGATQPYTHPGHDINSIDAFMAKWSDRIKA